ncbi:MAG: TldD/PmbA family protein [Clostridia bacterium]|nr:TldD/PmbA family protein [Clostridia bacterium]MBN2882054.1 TldD/PmbA family protein [Clostridia bacterium]
MKYKELAERIFKAGNEAGMQDMEVYVSGSREFEVKITRSEIDGYKLADNSGLGFRGFYNGKIGYSYTEKISDDSIPYLVKGAIENAEINDTKDQDYIFEGSLKYTPVNNLNTELDGVTEKQKIDFAIEMEKKALEMDSRIKASQYCMLGTGAYSSELFNTKGLALADEGNFAYAILMVLAEENGVYSSGFDFIIDNDFSKFDTGKLAKKAVKNAIDLLDAKPVESGEYEIVLDGMASAGLLGAVSSIFSARAVHKNLSLLKGKLGEKVAAECVTLVDDPFYKGGTSTSSFDGEGVATKYKNIIEGGVLKTFLHNLKSASKDGVESTGNASRDSYKSTIGISPTNMYFKPGDKNLEGIMEKISKGLYLVDLDGLHSGFNPISGDFSLGAKGYLIENGKVARSVNQITVSGNFYEMLMNIEEFASELRFGMGGGIGSPPVRIKKLSVAGE